MLRALPSSYRQRALAQVEALIAEAEKGLDAAAGPDRRDQGARQAATRAPPLGLAAPKPRVPALGRVHGGQGPSSSPLILAA